MQMWHPLQSFLSTTITLAFLGILEFSKAVLHLVQVITLVFWTREGLLNTVLVNQCVVTSRLTTKQFLVFMCPKCRNFTNAPVGQKRRRCSYCGKIIDIRKAQCALFDGPEQAATAVKEFNAARGGDEFDNAVERSREKIRTLLPTERVSAEDVATEVHSRPAEGKGKRLKKLLRNHASIAPCSLDKIETVCEEYQLDWLCVEDQLTKLANSGAIIFPRPWSVQAVRDPDGSETQQQKSQDISKDLLRFLNEQAGAVKVSEIVHHYERQGIPRASVEDSLEKLMKQGVIYAPRADTVEVV